MPLLAILGTIEAMPGKRDQILPLLKGHSNRCLRDEPGTVQFDVLVPEGDETRLLIYELYRDAAAFEQHRSNPSIAQWRQESAGLIAKVELTRCTVAD